MSCRRATCSIIDHTEPVSGVNDATYDIGLLNISPLKLHACFIIPIEAPLRGKIEKYATRSLSILLLQYVSDWS